jgi:hypothetical protein
MTFMDENMPEIRFAFCLATSQCDAIPSRRAATPHGFFSSFIVQRSAFTLVELMISIVLVLVLMVGIGKIFKLTSETVGGGMAIGTMTRGDRASQVTMQNDFAGAASDSPVFMICSERVSAFLTPQDKQSDLDGDPMTVPNTTGVETQTTVSQSAGGSAVSPAFYGDRNHRIDRIGFFARGQFNRQTSDNNSSFTGLPGSSEAYVWYGHVRLPGTTNVAADLPDGSGTYLSPATTIQFPMIGYKTTNSGHVDSDTANYGYYENNPIATNWVLGRMATLLVDQGTLDNLTNAGASFYPATTPILMSPLAYQTTALKSGTSGPTALNQSTDYAPLPDTSIFRSRYDLAGTTISEFRSIVTAAWNADQASSTNTWWKPLIYQTGNTLPFRYECNPYISKPMTGTGLAQTVPYFVPHVTQFIVEYAGDYLTQNPTTGAPSLTIAPDGQIDFYLDGSGNRHIRWYGFPRDTSGPNGVPDGQILTATGVANYNTITDVVPLCDIVYAITGTRTLASFEQEVPLPTAVTPPADYAAVTGGLAGNSHYYCVWRNAAPKLVRILMKIDDPNGRVRTGRWVEQVFAIQ